MLLFKYSLKLLSCLMVEKTGLSFALFLPKILWRRRDWQTKMADFGDPISDKQKVIFGIISDGHDVDFI